jgi:hypothetical protein
MFDRRLNRELRFQHQQKLTHDWIPFRAIVELWGDRAVEFLRTDLRSGRLPHTLFIHAGSRLQWVCAEGEPYIGREALDHCWIPRADFMEWCARWGLPVDDASSFSGEIAPVTAPEIAPSVLPPSVAGPDSAQKAKVRQAKKRLRGQIAERYRKGERHPHSGTGKESPTGWLEGCGVPDVLQAVPRKTLTNLVSEVLRRVTAQENTKPPGKPPGFR